MEKLEKIKCCLFIEKLDKILHSNKMGTSEQVKWPEVEATYPRGSPTLTSL